MSKMELKIANLTLRALKEKLDNATAIINTAAEITVRVQKTLNKIKLELEQDADETGVDDPDGAWDNKYTDNDAKTPEDQTVPGRHDT